MKERRERMEDIQEGLIDRGGGGEVKRRKRMGGGR